LRAGAAQAVDAVPVPVRRPPQPPVTKPRPRPAPVDDLGAFRIVDLELTDDQPPVGRRVTEVNWPPASHLLALRRDGHTIAVNSRTVLTTGDRLTLMVAADHVDRAADVLRTTPRDSSHAPGRNS
jgi:NhaP-type Na+/H+ and K+/H+ antiporter